MFCKWSRPCLPGLVTFMAASWTSLERKTRTRLQGVEGRHSYPTLFVWEKQTRNLGVCVCANFQLMPVVKPKPNIRCLVCWPHAQRSALHSFQLPAQDSSTEQKEPMGRPPPAGRAKLVSPLQHDSGIPAVPPWCTEGCRTLLVFRQNTH